MRSFEEVIISEAMSEHTKELGEIKNKLYRKLRNQRIAGKDTTALEQEYQKACDDYEAAKKADKQGVVNQASIDADVARVQATRPKQPQPQPQTTTSSKSKPKGNSNSQDYKDGYEAAIAAIKEAQKNKNKKADGGPGTPGELEGVPEDPSEMEQSGSGSGSSGSNGQQSTGSGGSGGGVDTQDESRTSKNDPNQGVVRPEDCMGPNQLGNIPNSPGAMMSKEVGDNIAEKEGYPKEGGNDSSVERDWADRARQAAKKMQGKGAGYQKLAGKIQDLHNSSKDWKKELRNIVGRSISPEDKRRGYTSNNILISQNRIALTDKQKFDNMDYMVVCIDTSGSMTQEFLENCLREVYHVALAKKPIKLVIMQFDTRVADIQEYTNIQQLKKDITNFRLKGGGGTDVKCCLDLLKKDKKYSRSRCELCMIFTDGYLDQYKRDPRSISNLVWVIIDNPGWEVQYKDAGTKCIHIKSDDF